MSKLPKISDAEWEVMKIVWSKEEITANEIIESLNGKQEWKNTTVKSLINRLLNKSFNIRRGMYKRRKSIIFKESI